MLEHVLTAMQKLLLNICTNNVDLKRRSMAGIPENFSTNLEP